MLTLLASPKSKECAKAQAYLDRRGIQYEYRDIEEQRPTYDELTEWLKLSGLPLFAFFNNRGSIFGSLAMGERLLLMREESRIAYIAASGKLVRRPLLVGDGFVLVGFIEREWDSRDLAHVSAPEDEQSTTPG